MRALRLILIAGAIFAVALSATLVILTRDFTASRDTGASLIGGNFTLTAADGGKVSDADFRGRFMLVFFGFTNCPDICRTELSAMTKAMQLLGAEAPKIAPIFISVDPERDTPAIIADYMKNFDSRIVGLTGTPAETSSAAKAYRVYYRKVDAEANSENYMVDHSAFTYLMDAQGKYLTHFTFNTPPDAMASVIKKHLSAANRA